MLEYHEFFATIATISATLWIVYVTVMLFMAERRSHENALDAFVFWVPVIYGLQVGSFFAEAMLISLAPLLPPSAYKLANTDVRFAFLWFVAAPLAVAAWRCYHVFRSTNDARHREMGFAAFLVFVVFFSAIKSIDVLSFAQPGDVARSAIDLLMLGVIVATIGVFASYRIVSKLGDGGRKL